MTKCRNTNQALTCFMVHSTQTPQTKLKIQNRRQNSYSNCLTPAPMLPLLPIHFRHLHALGQCLINILLKLHTMHNCPIIPSMTWFSRASRSISSCIWNCSAPDGRGHNSSRPMKICCQNKKSTNGQLEHLLVTCILTTWGKCHSKHCMAWASSEASA